MEATIDKPKAKRRGKGEGSLFQRDGRWVGVLTIGVDANGKQVRRWVYGDTQKAVMDEMTRLRGDRSAGILVRNSKMTVGEWITHYLKNIAPHGWKSRSGRIHKPCRATT